MYKFNFEDEEENKLMEESTDFILKRTDKKIKEAQKKLGQDLFETLSSDIEEWMYERYDNVRRRYFDGVVAFLLNQKNTHVNKIESLEKWLQGIGYDQQSFRKKIYQDNKETINKAITYDAIYEALETLFTHSYFRSWDFKDIYKGYPQTILIKEFLRQLILKDGFNDEVKNMLDNEIKQKLNELKDLKKEIGDIQRKIENLTK